MFFLILISIPAIFYLMPVLLNIGKSFLIVWVGLGILLAVLAGLQYSGQGSQDALARAMDNALLGVCALCWLTAGLMQGIRTVAKAQGYAGYRHWLGVIAGIVLIILAGLLVL